ncbi:transglutaminase-like domain-containing protein [Patescibacteria group bacterium]
MFFNPIYAMLYSAVTSNDEFQMPSIPNINIPISVPDISINTDFLSSFHSPTYYVDSVTVDGVTTVLNDSVAVDNVTIVLKDGFTTVVSKGSDLDEYDSTDLSSINTLDNTDIADIALYNNYGIYPAVMSHTPPGFEDIVERIYNTYPGEPRWNDLSDVEKMNKISSTIHNKINYSPIYLQNKEQLKEAQQQVNMQKPITIQSNYNYEVGIHHRKQLELLEAELKEFQAEKELFWDQQQTLTPQELRERDLFICGDYADLTTSMLQDIMPEYMVYNSEAYAEDKAHAFTIVEMENALYALDSTGGKNLTPLKNYIYQKELDPNRIRYIYDYTHPRADDAHFNSLLEESLQ